MPQTLFEKLWNSHTVTKGPGGRTLLYIDRHLVQEVSSPQAFEGLKARGLPVRRPHNHISVADHAVTTMPGRSPLKDSLAAKQLARLEENVEAFGLPYIPIGDRRHGIVHIIGPELGFTLPGTTLVCGDSHTSTHGAFGALAFGIGTSQCESVLASQCLWQDPLQPMRVWLEGTLQPGVSVKDIILALIAKIGVNGGRGYAIEYAGPAVDAMSMEARMTLCNMTIEAGARIGLIAPDETTFAYVKDRPLAPKGALWEQALHAWQALKSDEEAEFAKTVTLDVSMLGPHVTWGTTPADCADIAGRVPDPASALPEQRAHVEKSLHYMGLKPGTAFTDIPVDAVFIGSCTNARLEDLRRAAVVADGRKVAPGVRALVVPGSLQVEAAARYEGLDKVFKAAGFEWRNAGCSMCVAMNEDRLAPGERCASTSNRNFEGRQGPEARTHLLSPEMAAAAAVTGRLSDVRTLLGAGHG
ncbi:MAG: 3-isopropylmalate dehydratase large subunit [Pseudomonadota bacterium]